MVTLNITVTQGAEEKLVGSFLLKLPETVTNAGIDLAAVAATEGYVQGRGIPFEWIDEMTVEVEVLEDTRENTMNEILGMLQEAALKLATPANVKDA